MARGKVAIWGTVKREATGRRIACLWNGRLSYTRMADKHDGFGGIATCSWPEIWTFKPNDPNWADQLKKENK